ncbi:MAG: hydrogenase [Spirochaetota bacterium]
MTDFLNAIIVIVMILNLFALGTSRIASVIRIVAVQGALLGVVPLLLHWGGGGAPSAAVLLAAGAAIALKGLAIPAIMRRSLRSAAIKREVEPLVGFLPSVLLGAAGTALALVFSGRMGMAASQPGTLIVPASMATVLVGFIILTTRWKALSQVIGYLVLENGIYLFGMLLVEAIPFVVEMGALLDLFVGVFVISIITNHINEAFSSMDTRDLVTLKE